MRLDVSRIAPPPGIQKNSIVSIALPRQCETVFDMVYTFLGATAPDHLRSSSQAHPLIAPERNHMPEALRSVLRNTFKEKLAMGKVASTLSIRVFGSIEIVQIAKTCGFDALYIDLQHSSLSLQTTSQLSIAALGAGVMPIVRVP